MPDRHPSIAHLLKYFVYKHLPYNLQGVSRPFAELAHEITIVIDREKLPVDHTLEIAVEKTPDRTICERICPACGCEEQLHIRGKLHCVRCKRTLAACCD